MDRAWVDLFGVLSRLSGQCHGEVEGGVLEWVRDDKGDDKC